MLLTARCWHQSVRMTEAVALQTVANLASNACLAVVPLVLACGAGVSVLAAKIALESLKPGYERLDQPAMT